MTKKQKSTSIRDFQINMENPFIDKAIDKVNQSVVKKYKTASKTGEKAILKAVDDNGEILGHTQFIRQIELDEDKFTKLYLANFSQFFDLGQQAIRVFGYIMTRLKPNKDMFILIMSDALKYTGYKTDVSIRIGLTALLKSEIIARGPVDSIYFINPMVIFNGSRITYTKTYIKKRKKEEPSLFDEDELRQLESSPTIDPNM